jgi:hypothetical protein
MHETNDLSELEKKALRYGLATVDMEEAMSYLTAYEQLEIKDREHGNSMWYDARKGLLCAAIVAYCRPFKKSRSHGFADSHLKDTELETIRENTNMHALLQTKRDTFIAHADWTARSAEILSTTRSSASWKFPQPDVWEDLVVNEFNKHVISVYQECLQTAMKLAQQSQGIR